MTTLRIQDPKRIKGKLITTLASQGLLIGYRHVPQQAIGREDGRFTPLSFECQKPMRESRGFAATCWWNLSEPS